jgi:ABC-type lipoprotein export system ATPase subunit
VIEEEAARGATVLVVTHDLGFAEIGSTRLVLERGRIKKDAA